MERQKLVKLGSKLTEKEVRSLRLGDKVLISGTIFTGRDAVHKWLFSKKEKILQKKFANGILYHCGPVVKKTGKIYSFVAAGPTTSIREEPYQWKLIEDYKLRAVIGKGGMGKKTVRACKKFGCVYLHAVGGTGTLCAQSVKKIEGVSKLESFGVPEAIWEIVVEDFQAIVTIDAKGNSLHDVVEKKTQKKLKSLL